MSKHLKIRKRVKKMEKKATKKEMWTAILTDLENADIADKSRKLETVNHELELLNNRRTTKGTQTATAVLNESLALELYDKMNENQYYRASEVMQLLDEVGSTSKATAVLNSLCNMEKAERIKEKGRAYFVKVV